MAKAGYNYFDALNKMSSFAYEAAQYLDDAMEDFNPDIVLEKVEGVHDIEHNADDKRHELIMHLTKEFITPIEREDIMELVQKLDTVVDNIDDVLRYTYMFNIKTIRTSAQKFTNLIVRCTRSMNIAMEKFPYFRRSQDIKDNIVEVNMLEEEGDKLHINALRELFADSDVLGIIGWSKVLDCLESCLDACEEVVDTVERIIMKNT